MKSSHDDEYIINIICQVIEKTEYEDLPPYVLDFAKRHILDTIGAIIGGSSMKHISSVVDFVKEQGGRAQSTIPLFGGQVPASLCAFALGPAARATDLGDCHEEAGHSAEYTLPALIAAAGLKPGVSGQQLLLSFILGQEILIRTGKAYHCVSCEQNSGSQGGHYIFGPVVAVGKLLGLNSSQLRTALGMAKSMTQPYDMSMYTPANFMISLHHGFIAQDAVNICLLAQKDLIREYSQIFTGPRGFYSLFARADNDIALSMISDGIGQRWEMTKTTLKPYPSCNCTHTSITGILDQMGQYGFSYSDIAAIHLDESQINWTIVAQPYDIKWNPRSITECQFSLPYTVAAAAYDGDFFLDAYIEEKRFNRDIRELMRKITVKMDMDLPAYSAIVTTKLKNGMTHSGKYLTVKGHPEDPFTDEELIIKFKKCSLYSLHPLPESTINTVIERILSLEQIEDIGHEILLPLTP
ncbi:MAG: MmgE/PrpD family protein [Syntrophomonadaceae bacterium]|jgi:2-methylcitrate dehydratase PrpD|nr:MmgE/PrpD family protein [Syntrophomonadaceae bacterium]